MDFLNYLSQQYGNLGGLTGGLGSGLHSWLSSLSAPSMPAANPGMNMLASYPSAPGARLQSPTFYPAGSTMLQPGGTPETATPVGGQPAAPSFWDQGPQGYPSSLRGAHSGMLQFPQAWLAAMSGLGQEAAQSATAAALQRAMAYHAALLG